MPSWKKWTSVAIIAIVLWFFPVPVCLNLGHVYGDDFILNTAGVVWLITLVGLVLLLITCLYRSRG